MHREINYTLNIFFGNLQAFALIFLQFLLSNFNKCVVFYYHLSYYRFAPRLFLSTS